MHRRARMLFPILTLVLLIGACGCSSLVRERLADSPLPGDTHSAGSDEIDTGIRAVSVKTIQRAKGPDSPRLPSPDDTWLERQRFIFARAWQEMCRDMNYESIDSFQELAPEANREVRMMREDLAGAGGTVSTTSHRPGAP